jgi:hypothetical protein
VIPTPEPTPTPFVPYQTTFYASDETLSNGNYQVHAADGRTFDIISYNNWLDIETNNEYSGTVTGTQWGAYQIANVYCIGVYQIPDYRDPNYNDNSYRNYQSYRPTRKDNRVSIRANIRQ